MKGRAIRVLELAGAPAEIGAAHGEAHAAAIRAYAADRLARSADESGLSRAALLEIAAACLPAHARYDAGLADEMAALAAAAGISVAEALVVGGYTDFVDAVRARAGHAPFEDDCTAVLVPDGLADGRGGYLAQTWDMHASATGHVVLLRLAPRDAPAALVFTTVGCVGQIGINEAGVAIGINNLAAADGRPGVTWPFVVRKALATESADAALAAVLGPGLAGGHSYLILDAQGRGYSVEAMPTVRHVFPLVGDALVHTNHCLAADTIAVEGPRPAALAASSVTRREHAQELLARDAIGVDDLIALTRDERAICRRVEPPFDYESCGAVVMRPASRELWACWGRPSENAFEHFAL